ncbi:MAG: DUF1800 domain-containing protein [Myxococcota bacterium]
MAKKDAYIASHRFGLGPRPGEIEAASSDPRRWVVDQISPSPLPAELHDLDTTQERLEQFYQQKEMQAEGGGRLVFRERVLPEIATCFQLRVNTERPLLERMVAFWSNHFTIGVGRARAAVLAPVFQREAIRPNVFARFEELLLAAVTHPAMLDYLDNVRSVGARSPLGARRGLSLNENLAREVLELHTLGVDGGYTQPDIENLAAILSGWGVYDPRLEAKRPRFERLMRGEPVSVGLGSSTFYHFAHEPGPKILLGKRYAEDGPDELRRALRDLASHPSTARFVATKLARHFVADEPPEPVIKKLVRVYRETRGDLAAVTKAVALTERAWSTPWAKAKTPQDYIVSSLRVTGMRSIASIQLGESLTQMGQTPFGAPSPQGWADTASAWLTPGSLMRRVEWAQGLARQLAGSMNPNTLLQGSLGPLASTATQRLVSRAASPGDAIAFVLASRELQRR